MMLHGRATMTAIIVVGSGVTTGLGTRRTVAGIGATMDGDANHAMNDNIISYDNVKDIFRMNSVPCIDVNARETGVFEEDADPTMQSHYLPYLPSSLSTLSYILNIGN